MRHAVIMAGGAGVRLWPLSRKSRPKQLLRLFGGTSLLRQSYERVASMLGPEQIHVITGKQHLPMVTAELPELPAENLIGEPVGRDTACAIGLASSVVAGKDPEAVIGIFTADHIITPTSCFCGAVERAFVAAEQNTDALVTMGIRPTRPDTNYGYIWRGERISEGVFLVKKFTEKPSMTKAMKYLAGGEYYWNSGMFTWQAATILEQLKTHLPSTSKAIREIARAWSTDERDQTLERLYPNLMKISIDFAVMEKAQRVLVVEMGCHWVDVGSWPALESIVHADDDGNLSTEEHVVHLGSRGNIVVSEEKHLIATIGVNDLVIVHSPDATLICKKRDAGSIKELVDNVQSKYDAEYL
jgi:mannose-1-phosphate guanylyltransferase